MSYREMLVYYFLALGLITLGFIIVVGALIYNTFFR